MPRSPATWALSACPFLDSVRASSGAGAGGGVRRPPPTPSASVGSRRWSGVLRLLWEGLLPPSPVAKPAGQERKPRGSFRPCSTLPPSWVGETLGGRVVFRLAPRLHLSVTARVMRAAPAKAERTPATTAVDPEPESCPVGGASGLVVGVVRAEGEGVGAGEAPANDIATGPAVERGQRETV